MSGNIPKNIKCRYECPGIVASNNCEIPSGHYKATIVGSKHIHFKCGNKVYLQGEICKRCQGNLPVLDDSSPAACRVYSSRRQSIQAESVQKD